MKLSDFDYSLPEELIAQVPLESRDQARMLWLNRRTGEIEHLAFSDLTEILLPGDLLVMNDTRVTARRLVGQKRSGAKVEALVLSRKGSIFTTLAKPAKKMLPGVEVLFVEGLTAIVVENHSEGLVDFEFDEPERVLESGSIPLPPYIRTTLADESRYQTVYGGQGGSAASPTAGLHFTIGLLEKLRQRGVQTAHVTLDVGIDTFRPMASENVEDHPIHGEMCEVPEETADAVACCKGRIFAVGTTSVRTLESLANGTRRVEPGRRLTSLFITPGYEFKVVDGMLTNFHLPRTTMLCMLAAFAGREQVITAYEQAVAAKYRFLSFGDSMLIV